MESKRSVKCSQCFRRPQCRNPDGKSSGPAPRLNKIYRQKEASSGVVVLGGVQAIKLEFGSEQKLFDAITTAVFDLEGGIHDSLKNLWDYVIQEQLRMEMQVFVSQVQTGQGQEALDWAPGKGKSPTLFTVMKQGRCQLQDGSGKYDVQGKGRQISNNVG